MTAVILPAGVQVFERGWLSSNNILIQGKQGTALIDSGYGKHAPQTLALVQSALQGRPLDHLINTHLHSDHCGGNATLQAAYPLLQTHIPPGQADHVRAWDAQALSYTTTGQQCPRFGFDATLQPGTEVCLGDDLWQVHAAPGHDTHSVILFEPMSRTLVSADALWERGFGVVFPELDGEAGFSEVAATLDLMESLQANSVIPGHGSPFADAPAAIAWARQRLQGFAANPAKHRLYSAKVLLKFKLLESQCLPRDELLTWAKNTSYFVAICTQQFTGLELPQAVDQLVEDLVRSGAAKVQDTNIYNA